MSLLAVSFSLPRGRIQALCNRLNPTSLLLNLYEKYCFSVDFYYSRGSLSFSTIVCHEPIYSRTYTHSLTHTHAYLAHSVAVTILSSQEQTMAKTPATRGVQLDFLQDDGRVELIEILESVSAPLTHSLTHSLTTPTFSLLHSLYSPLHYTYSLTHCTM